MMPRPTAQSESPIVTLPEPLFAGRFSNQRNVDWHTHDGPELVLVISGDCATQVGDVRMTGGPGTLWICPAKVPQYQFNYTHTQTVYVYYRGESALKINSPRALQVDPDGRVMRWMIDLAAMFTQVATAQNMAPRALLLAILEEVAALEHDKNIRRPMPEQLTRAVSWIQQNLTRPLRVPALARHANISEGHLTVLFRKYVGLAPLQYQHQLRIQKSQLLLLSPYMSVKQIAAECGFADVNYFVRIFSARCGLPPGQWRSQKSAGNTRQGK